MIGYIIYKKEGERLTCISEYDIDIVPQKQTFMTLNSHVFCHIMDIKRNIITVICNPGSIIHRVDSDGPYLSMTGESISLSDFFRENKEEWIEILSDVFDRAYYNAEYIHAGVYNKINKFYRYVSKKNNKKEILSEINRIRRNSKPEKISIEKNSNINDFFDTVISSYHIDEYFVNSVSPYFLYKLIERYRFFSKEQIQWVWSRIKQIETSSGAEPGIYSYNMDNDMLCLEHINEKFDSESEGKMYDVSESIEMLNLFSSQLDEKYHPDLFKIALFKRADIYPSDIKDIDRQEYIYMQIFNPNTKITMKQKEMLDVFWGSNRLNIDILCQNIRYKKYIDIGKIWNVFAKHPSADSGYLKEYFLNQILLNQCVESITYPNKMSQTDFNKIQEALPKSYKLMKNYGRQHPNFATTFFLKYLNLYTMVLTGWDKDYINNLMSQKVNEWVFSPLVLKSVTQVWESQIRKWSHDPVKDIEIHGEITEFYSELTKKSIKFTKNI